MFGENSKKAVQDADVVLILGTYVFPEVFPSLEMPFRADARIYHIDLDAYEIAKNHPVTLGICASPRQTLRKINRELERTALPFRQMRSGEFGQDALQPQQDGTVTAAFMEALSSMTDEHLIIFDEALTASGYLTKYLPRTQEGTFFQTRGGSLGVGIPGGMGILLACPDRQVIAFTGDGGSMYTIQALYTAKRYHIPVKIVICNNRRYHLLDQNINVYWEEQGIPVHAYPDCFSLEPMIDFVTLARSMGMEGIRVETPEQAAAAAEKLVYSKEPFLVDLNTQ